MKTQNAPTILGLLAVVVATASCEFCFPPQYESYSCAFIAAEYVYSATDYDRGLILVAPEAAPAGDTWYLFDLNAKRSYYNDPDFGCTYIDLLDDGLKLLGQCLPDNAQYWRTINGHMLYNISLTDDVSKFIGINEIYESGYYERYMTSIRFRNSVFEVFVEFKTNIGITDPTVLDKDLSACVKEDPVNLQATRSAFLVHNRFPETSRL